LFGAPQARGVDTTHADPYIAKRALWSRCFSRSKTHRTVGQAPLSHDTVKTGQAE